LLTLEGLRIIYERNQAHGKRRGEGAATSGPESHENASTASRRRS
jgi:hypothetical protein